MKCPLFYEVDNYCFGRQSACSPGDEICVAAIRAYCSGRCEEMRKMMDDFRNERDATISRARCEKSRREYVASENARREKAAKGEGGA